MTTRTAGFQLAITLAPLPTDPWKHRGIYGPQKDMMPDRFMFLEPAALASMAAWEQAHPGTLWISDCFRNAIGSLGRRQKNAAAHSGVATGKLPGSSAHGYGFALDVEVDHCLQTFGKHIGGPVTKKDWDHEREKFGWYCHRRDHAGGSESWHENFLGDDPTRWLAHAGTSTAGAIEAKVQALYGPFSADKLLINETLERLRYKPDQSGIRRFQGDWTLEADGIAGPMTQRVLLFVGARFVDATGAPLPIKQTA